MRSTLCCLLMLLMLASQSAAKCAHRHDGDSSRFERAHIHLHSHDHSHNHHHHGHHHHDSHHHDDSTDGQPLLVSANDHGDAIYIVDQELQSQRTDVRQAWFAFPCGNTTSVPKQKPTQLKPALRFDCADASPPARWLDRKSIRLQL